MKGIQKILQSGHTNIYLPAGIQKLTLASLFSEYRLFLKTINGEIIIDPINIIVSRPQRGLCRKTLINKLFI
jgi:hypothetical protein